ncbi:unnamed protein product [Medioppia subpectinata]|uniref:Uncharacterized protein n=1 Tax=Medioppia subpectinata TaxID=1979941 RepID=A0A7R9LGS2_9ACAR|nr:unnamed protein product [Medioppia subpectinata]CAG2118703.1 unnamed protein product [Medioppia subpectinata]
MHKMLKFTLLFVGLIVLAYGAYMGEKFVQDLKGDLCYQGIANQALNCAKAINQTIDITKDDFGFPNVKDRCVGYFIFLDCVNKIGKKKCDKEKFDKLYHLIYETDMRLLTNECKILRTGRVLTAGGITVWSLIVNRKRFNTKANATFASNMANDWATQTRGPTLNGTNKTVGNESVGRREVVIAMVCGIYGHIQMPASVMSRAATRRARKGDANRRSVSLMTASSSGSRANASALIGQPLVLLVSVVTAAQISS